MRIVHLLPPLTRGGAEKVAVDLANQVARDGHDVTIVAAFPTASEQPRHAIDARVTLRYVSESPARLGKYVSLGPWLRRNREWLLSQDVVHCHLTFGAIAGTAIKLMRRLNRRRRPVVLETYHAVGMPIRSWNRALAALLARTRDGFALMAEDDYWSRFQLQRPALDVRVIPNGVALPERIPAAHEIAEYKSAAGVPAGALVIGTVGRIVKGRMPLRMIEVFAEADRLGGSETHFLMGGDGDLLDEAKRHAAALGIGDRVHFPGLVEDPFLAFGAIDVYISINVGPITGIAGLEAAGSGKPVIALQARQDYETGAGDWIWSSAIPAEVAAESIRLLRDPKARDALAEQQSAKVRTELSGATMASAYEAFYADCLARCPE
jgi:glycosyltransferase involved in cell wall biosynthesis